jgi:hypothetical protein
VTTKERLFVDQHIVGGQAGVEIDPGTARGRCGRMAAKMTPKSNLAEPERIRRADRILR